MLEASFVHSIEQQSIHCSPSRLFGKFIPGVGAHYGLQQMMDTAVYTDIPSLAILLGKLAKQSLMGLIQVAAVVERWHQRLGEEQLVNGDLMPLAAMVQAGTCKPFVFIGTDEYNRASPLAPRMSMSRPMRLYRVVTRYGGSHP